MGLEFCRPFFNAKRKSLLLFLKDNFQGFYLAGGTALALYFGQRESIDFDFFTEKDIDWTTIMDLLIKKTADFIGL